MFVDRKIYNVNDVTTKNICTIQSDVEGISSSSSLPIETEDMEDTEMIDLTNLIPYERYFDDDEDL